MPEQEEREEQENPLARQSYKSLRMRQQLGRYLIRQIRTEWRGDGDWREAKGKLEKELREITVEIRKRNKARREAAGEPEPPTQRMQMKPAKLGTKAPGGSNGALADRLREELEARGVFVEKVYDT